MSDEQKTDPEKIPQSDEKLYGQTEEGGKKSKGCCTCTKKKLAIVAVVVIMLLLYGVGLAIGLAIGLNKDDDGGGGDDGVTEKPEKLVPTDVVVSDSAECADIGRDILAKSGTAVDAAIATLICNGVTTPHSMGIGGGCFMVIYDRYEEKTITIDGRETVPRYMTSERYKNLTDEHVNARRIAVPGELKAYKEAHDRYGRLPWRDLFEPTIKMMRSGYPLSDATAQALQYLKKRGTDFTKYPGICDLFCSNTTTGEVKEAGDWIHWPKLADTLQGIADEGIDYLYNSPLTNTIVEEIQAEGGLVDVADFIIDYKALVGEPYTVQYGNYTIHAMNGATGGPVVALIFNILKRYEWYGFSTLDEKVDFYHKLLEAMKFSDADRMTVGDPAFDNSTWILEKMLSEEYADILRTKITEKTHDPSYYTEATESWDDFMGTSHVSVLSSYGDAVSVTTTINWYFGSTMMSNATGIIWNNEMDDFDPVGRTNVNQVEPGKRPRSSMAPIVVTDNENNVKMVIGGSGGSYIATSVAQVLAKIFLLDMPLEEAVDDKRIHHKLIKNEMVLEKGFPEDIKEKLNKERGHDFSYYPANIFSVIESIYVDGTLKGYNDKRKLSGKASYIYRKAD